MRKLLLALLLSLTAVAAAHAQGRRPNSLALTCHAARSLVRAHGAVVMTTGPDLYDRYVRDGGFCATSLTTEPAYVPTADLRQCFVGYRCVPIVVPNDVPFPRR
jgi:hypothetical protein